LPSEWRAPAIAIGLATLVIAALALGRDVFNFTIDGESRPHASEQSTLGPTASAYRPEANSPSAETTDGSTPTRSTAGALRRDSGSNPLVLQKTYYVDLDSLSANWDVQDTPSSEGDLQLYSTSLQGRNGLDFARIDGPPTFAACNATTGYMGYVELSELDAGNTFCVRTSEERLGAITVNEPGIPMSLDVIIWEP
jgi:hypothetical protein